MTEKWGYLEMRQPRLRLVILLSGLRFELAARFPAKLGLAGNLVLPADVFPRQDGFEGFSNCDLN